MNPEDFWSQPAPFQAALITATVAFFAAIFSLANTLLNYFGVSRTEKRKQRLDFLLKKKEALEKALNQLNSSLKNEISFTLDDVQSIQEAHHKSAGITFLALKEVEHWFLSINQTTFCEIEKSFKSIQVVIFSKKSSSGNEIEVLRKLTAEMEQVLKSEIFEATTSIKKMIGIK